MRVELARTRIQLIGELVGKVESNSVDSESNTPTDSLPLLVLI